MTGVLRNLARARESVPEGGAMEAFHGEGPYISPEDGPRGAHPQRWVRAPDLDEFRRFQDAAEGHVRLLTLSPEWPGAPAFIEKVVSDGVVVGIGHTKASAEQIDDLILWLMVGVIVGGRLGHGDVHRHRLRAGRAGPGRPGCPRPGAHVSAHVRARR